MHKFSTRLSFLIFLNVGAAKNIASLYDTYSRGSIKKEEYLLGEKEYWQNELKSLGIEEPDHLQNEPNDKEDGLDALAESIKSVYYQAYKTAYKSSSNNNASNNSSSKQ